MSGIDETHDPALVSWVDGAGPGGDFPVQNLPLGIFSFMGDQRRPGVAIGDFVLDLTAVADLLDEGEPTGVVAVLDRARRAVGARQGDDGAVLLHLRPVARQGGGGQHVRRDRAGALLELGPAGVAAGLAELRARGDGRRSARDSVEDRVFEYSRRGRRDLATREMERWVARHPNDRAMLLALARLLNEQGRTDESIARYQQLLGRDKRSAGGR